MHSFTRAFGTLAIVTALGIIFAIATAPGAFGTGDQLEALKIEAIDTTVFIGVPGGSGSGTVVYSDAGSTLILTAAHVVSNGKTKEGTITFVGEDTDIPFVTVAVDVKNDLALVRVKDGVIHQVAVFYTGDLLAGMTAWTVGSPLGMPTMPTAGIISVPTTEGPDGLPVLIVAAPTIMGNSGGGTYVEIDGQFVWVGMPDAVSNYPAESMSPMLPPIAVPLPTIGLDVPADAAVAFLLHNGIEPLTLEDPNV